MSRYLLDTGSFLWLDGGKRESIGMTRVCVWN